MARRKPFYVNTKKLMMYDSLDKLMFGYVLGMQRALPGNKLNRCVEMFMDEFNLHEDNYPLDHGLQTYYRMLKSFQEYRKGDGKFDK